MLSIQEFMHLMLLVVFVEARCQCQVGVDTSVNAGRRSQKEIPLEMLVLYGAGIL